jgi:hypothetical protein
MSREKWCLFSAIKFLFRWRSDCRNFITSFQFCCFGFLSSHSLQWRGWKWKSLEEFTGCPVVVELLEALSRVPLKARSVQQFMKKHKNNINKMLTDYLISERTSKFQYLSTLAASTLIKLFVKMLKF